MKRINQNAEDLLRDRLKHIPVVRKLSFSKRNGNIIKGKIEAQVTYPIQLLELDQGYPKRIENAIVSSDSKDEACYRIVVAPYISSTAAEICKKNGAGYLDYSGNCLLSLESIYMSDIGHPNLFPKDNKVKNIFRSSSVVTSNILRVLLTDVSVQWKIQDLSKYVGCSIGMVSRVKDYLCEQLWGQMDKNGFKIIDAQGLIQAWSSSFSHEGIETLSGYSLDTVSVTEERLARIMKENTIKGGFTGFSGGARYTPNVRYSKIHLWIYSKQALDFFEKSGLKEVDSGANVVLYIANEDDIFWDSREKDSIPIVSPVQAYLDLMCLKGRGEEMADSIMRKEILK